MSAEYTDIHVDVEKGLVYVHGKYPFDSVGRVENVVMYFPIPNSSMNVAVYMNGKPISWRWSNMTYSTFLGRFRMTVWSISNISDKFIIDVYYVHKVHNFKNGSFSFIYAVDCFI